MPRHLFPYLIPIILALGCQGVIDGGDDEAIADTPDGTFNEAIQFPDARVYMYGMPGAPFGEFGEMDGVKYPLESEYEWVPFAHSSPPLPAYPSNILPFPYPRGVPDLDIDSPAHADKWWDNYEMTRGGLMGSHGIPATAQPRSWLAAAYGFYVPTPSNPEPFFLPLDHPRPPGMHSPLWLLNPVTWSVMVGRANVVGVPCNTRKPVDIDKYGPWSISPQTQGDMHHHCVDYIRGGISAVSANWYTASDALAWSSFHATCLDAGGDGESNEYPMLDRATNQITDPTGSGRQGLFILNIDEIDEAIAAVRWVLGQAGLEEVADEMLDEFEEWAGENASLINSVQFTAPYYTDSGICGFKAELSTVPIIVDGEEQDQIVTTAGCPHGHHAVFVPFSSHALATGAIERVGGYCAVSFSVFAAGNDPLIPDSDPNTPLAVLPPEYSVADTPTGVRMYTLNGDRMTVPTLSVWASNVALVPGHEGWMLDAVTDRLTGSTILGESVLDQFELEVGDVVSGIDSTISLLPGREEQARSAALAVLCERDRECESSYVDTPLDVLLAAYVEQRLLEWETVTFWVHRGDMVLPTYLRLRPAQL